MSVLEFVVYDRNTPNGTALATLTDADCIAMDFRVGLNQEGAGSFTISRHSALATRTNLPDNAYIKVKIPSVSASPIFGFWMDEFKAKIISSDEEGGEHITLGGPGTIDILRRAILMDVPYVVTQPARGSLDVVGKWHWINEPWGAVLTRGIEEGQDEPHTPLQHVTIDFDRVDDSDAIPWPTISTIFEVTIGMDVHTLMRELVKAGGLYVVPQPNLLIQAFQTYGRDLTADVIFAKAGIGLSPGNIITEYERTGRGTRRATVALVRGKDEVYATVTGSGPTPGQVMFVPYDDTDELTHLTSVGTQALLQREAEQEAIELEITPGFTPASGLYMPGPEGTDGHFWIGDTITVDTGTDGEKWEDPENSRLITGIRCSLAEATDDTDDETSARSLRVVVELGGTTQDAATQVPQPRITTVRAFRWDSCTDAGRPTVSLGTGVWHVHVDPLIGGTPNGSVPYWCNVSGTDYTLSGGATSFMIVDRDGDVVVDADNLGYSIFADKISDDIGWMPPDCGA